MASFILASISSELWNLKVQDQDAIGFGFS